MWMWLSCGSGWLRHMDSSPAEHSEIGDQTVVLIDSVVVFMQREFTSNTFYNLSLLQDSCNLFYSVINYSEVRMNNIVEI